MSNSLELKPARKTTLCDRLLFATIPTLAATYLIATEVTSIDLHLVRIWSGILVPFMSFLALILAASCWIHDRRISRPVWYGSIAGLAGTVFSGYLLTIAVDEVAEAAARSN